MGGGVQEIVHPQRVLGNDINRFFIHHRRRRACLSASDIAAFRSNPNLVLVCRE
jgi:hypothetical protein